jgi:hypothetical protein
MEHTVAMRMAALWKYIQVEQLGLKFRIEGTFDFTELLDKLHHEILVLWGTPR